MFGFTAFIGKKKDICNIMFSWQLLTATSRYMFIKKSSTKDELQTN